MSLSKKHPKFIVDAFSMLSAPLEEASQIRSLGSVVSLELEPSPRHVEWSPWFSSVVHAKDEDAPDERSRGLLAQLSIPELGPEHTKRHNHAQHTNPQVALVNLLMEG